nr:MULTISPECIES: ATP-binding protein [Myxococcaceae]
MSRGASGPGTPERALEGAREGRAPARSGRPWRGLLPPLRYAVPLALLFFGGLVGLYDYVRSARTAERQVEQMAREDLGHRMADLQSHLEFLLRAGETERVREEVARLGADVNLERGLLVDDAGRVVAATRRELVGREAAGLEPPLPAAARGVTDGVRQRLGGQVQEVEGGGALVGAFPVVWGGRATELWPDRVGLLVMELDLTRQRAVALRSVQMRVLERMALLALLAFALWLMFHVSLGRRVQSLVGAARRLAAGEGSARADVGGSDELARVGEAFDEMAEQVQEARERLEASEERTRLLLDATAEGLVGLDLEGRCTFCNAAAVRLLGAATEGPEALIGQDLEHFRPHFRPDGSLLPREESELVQELRTRRPVHVEGQALRRADGSALPVELWSHPVLRGGELVGRVVSFVDISERKRAEDARAFLLEASAQLAELTDEAQAYARVARLAVPQLAEWCVVDTVDEEGRPVRRAAAHADARREELLRTLGERYPPGWDSPSPTAHVLMTGRPLRVNSAELLQAYSPDAGHAELLRGLGARVALALPLQVRGQTLGVLMLVHGGPGFRYGPHEVALAEELARRAAVALDNARLYRQAQEAVRLREEFLSVASHELHTPLTPLQLQLQVLQRALAARSAPEALAPKMQKAVGQVRRLSRLVDDLLDVSRIVAGRLPLQPEEVDLRQLTDEVVERFADQAAQAGSSVRVREEDGAPGGPVIGRWDRLRLEQVLTNLLTNALKYGAGRPVEIELGRGPEGGALWRIRDRGIGIAPEALSRIFGRFERAVSARAYGGLGLGLYISQQIVRAHGGRIEVESRPGEGSTFTAYLPLEGAPAQPALAPGTSGASGAARGGGEEAAALPGAPG